MGTGELEYDVGMTCRIMRKSFIGVRDDLEFWMGLLESASRIVRFANVSVFQEVLCSCNW